MDGFPRGAAAIVGAATFGIGESPGFDTRGLAARAALCALTDAGISLHEVDGLFTCLADEVLSGLQMAEYLGIRPRVTDNNRMGGSSFLSHLMWATLALHFGQCDVALICYGSNQRTASNRLVSSGGLCEYEAIYKPLFPVSSYALAAARHMHEFGTRAEHLAQVAVSARDWARLNPEAYARGPLTIEECLRSRLVSDPLRARDCCLVTDGAAAVVVVRAERAKQYKNSAVYVLGAAASTDHHHISFMPDLTTTAAVDSGRRAFAQAGLKPSDVDVVELYDAFTINTILFLEDLGFCAKGEGGGFVANGRIGPGGQFPVNTNGGGLSCVHPGMYGLFTLVEAALQLSGRAGERQVKGAQVALAHGNGGVLSSQATVLLGTESTL
jgi:acetyl-CoA acetyltransferase